MFRRKPKPTVRIEIHNVLDDDEQARLIKMVVESLRRNNEHL